MKSAFVAKGLRQQIQVICVLAFLIKLSGSGLFGGEKVTSHADLSNPGETLVFDLGSHVAGETLDVSLDLVNKLGQAFNVQIKPSCGCTNLSTTNLSAKPNERISIKSTVILPEVARKFEANLLCEDVETGVRFNIVMVAESRNLVSFTPKRISISSTAGKQKLEFMVVTNSSNHRLDSVSIAGVSKSSKIVAVEHSDAGVKLTVEFSPTNLNDSISDEISFATRVEVLDTLEPITLQEVISVDYIDRIKMGPTRPTATLSASQFTLPVYLISSSGVDWDIEHATILNDSNRLPLQIGSSKKRGDKVLLLTLMAAREDWNTFSHAGLVDSCTVVIQDRNGAKAKAFVTVVETFDEGQK